MLTRMGCPKGSVIKGAVVQNVQRWKDKESKEASCGAIQIKEKEKRKIISEK